MNTDEASDTNGEVEDAAPNYQVRLGSERTKIQNLAGTEVPKTHKWGAMTWKVVHEVHRCDATYNMERSNLGLKDFDFLDKSDVTVFSEIFLHLKPIYWEEELQMENFAIGEENLKIRRRNRSLPRHEHTREKKIF